MFRVALFSLVALQLVQAMPTHSFSHLLDASDMKLMGAATNETLASIKAATIKYIIEIRGEKNSVVELFRKARVGTLEGLEKARKHAINKINEDIKANSTTELLTMPEMLMADATADLVLYDTREQATLMQGSGDVDMTDLEKAKSSAVHDIKRMKLDTLEYIKRLKKKSEDAIQLAKVRGVESLGLTPSDEQYKTEAEKEQEAEAKMTPKRESLALDADHQAVLIELLKQVDENELVQLLTPAWASDVSSIPWTAMRDGSMSMEKVMSVALAAIKAAKISCLLYLKTIKKNMLEAIAEARNNAIKDVKAFVATKTPEE